MRSSMRRFLVRPKMSMLVVRAKISATGMSDPNPFFLQLITKPYVYNVVIAPHYYPPSISHSTACYTGTCLYE